MRLLNVHTLVLEEFADDDLPPYAITSHRWGKTSDETTYDDVANGRQQQKPGYQKVLKFCEFVKAYDWDLDWMWIDTCCIDKRNSVELHEAINSMYRWYAEAAVCIAFLHDVGQENGTSYSRLELLNCEWFKRGWTLQELLAPSTVVFADAAWQFIAAKMTASTPTCLRLVQSSSMMQDYGFELSKAAGIPHEVLAGEVALSSVDVNTKMSWMRKRNTTRTEDRAYCLLGLFSVYLSPIYGEREHAMVRLQREIAAVSGLADFMQLRKPRVPLSWATKNERQMGIRAVTDVPRFRVENARPPGPGTELPDASRVNQTAFTQRQSGTTDRRSAEKLVHNTLQPGRSPAEFTSRSSNRDAIRGAFFTETSTKPQLSTKSSSSTASARGVIKELIMPGDGITKAKAGDYVTIEYTSKFLDGKQFDSSVGRGDLNVTIGTGKVIKGWEVGILEIDGGMTLGEKAKLTITGDMAYGSRGVGPIPPNATLIFDIQLKAINGKRA